MIFQRKLKIKTLLKYFEVKCPINYFSFRMTSIGPCF